MRLVHFYSRLTGKEKNARSFHVMGTFLFASLFMLFLPFVSRAIFPPNFNPYSSPLTMTICGNQPTDISSWLSVTDLDAGETLTWSVLSAPINGTLSGFDATAPSGGSSSVPTGVTYMPDPGATTDNFTILVDDGTGNSATMVVYVNINAGPSLTVGAFPAVCKGVTNAVLTFSDLSNVGPDTAVFDYTGGIQTWTVPMNVTSVNFDVMGAAGGNDDYTGAPNPGKGGRVQGTLSVAPLSNLNIVVGGRGNDGSALGASGGYNGGGNTYFYFVGCGGAGGGASDIRIGGTALSDRKVVAGGGAGSGAEPTGSKYGGAGGGLTGGNSENNDFGANAKGGTQTAGGASAVYPGWLSGAAGTSGMGGDGSTQGVSGGGGGGYFGGGGGVWSGGGGGSSYTDGSLTYSNTHTRGVRDGNGLVTLYYNNPGTYTIIWDATADAAGFVNVASATLPTNNQFNIAVPYDVEAGTYHATLTISNINCTSVEYPIEVTVKPLPDVVNPGDQVLCHGEMTSDIALSGSVSGSDYNWVNSNPAIGMDAAGAGHIPAFYPINSTPDPVSATFTVTPVANGCIGNPVVFHIVDNPVPALNSTATPAGICNNTMFSYLPTSLTTGTSFAWSRAAVTGIANPANNGTGNPNETLLNLSNAPIAVTYVYTLTANTCSNTANVTVDVNPTPTLTSSATPPALCNGETFNYTPVSSVAAAVITWARPVVAGISNTAGSGTGAISETLMNVTSTPKTVTYVITMTINGCAYTENVTVVVNPLLNLTSSTAAINACEGDMVNYLATSSVPGVSITWTRAAVTGISNPATSGTGGFSEALDNTTPDAIPVTYAYTLSAYGCTNVQNVVVNVKPKPQLSSTLNPAGICTNTLFSYHPTSATAGSTFLWARDSVVGIANPVVTGSGNVSEILMSTADTSLDVRYIYAIFADGCADSDYVVVRVNPLPKISNDISALAVCDSALFSFNPTSYVPGASFAWSRAVVAGVNNVPATGTGNPNERLNNTTYISVPVTYVYTVTANGCVNTQNVVVDVRPSAVLVHDTTRACSGMPFHFTPESYTVGVDFAWSRSSTSGVTPDTASGMGDIVDTLTQGTSSPIVVVYNYDMTTYGCTNTDKLYVTLNPAPSVPVIGTHPSATLCASTTYMNFGANSAAPAGMSYSWSVDNAILVGTGSTGQYAVVSFPTSGSASVTLTVMTDATTCISSTTDVITVGEGTASSPEVIYFDNQFICRETNVDSYQWGYDDANTLDSTVLVGETNQNYYAPYADMNGKYYWVITSKNGCMQKTYYNRPTTSIDDVAQEAGMKLYPNPASSMINVEISKNVMGDIRVDVYDMMGRQVQSAKAINNKATFNINDLAAGAYLVDCYSDGVKIAAARFIKN